MSLRALKWLVGVMGVLIVVGTVALAWAIVQRLGGAAGGGGRIAAEGSVAALPLSQPPGARIAGVAAVEDGVAVWVARPDGDRVLLIDPRRNRVVGEIRLGE